jgi:glyoxylase-like metal-dependent hydrolase (beta-lactamase superfamily II)
MLPLQARMFGSPASSAPPVEKFLEDEEIIEFGNHRLRILHTPGHSPGSVSFKLLTGSEAIFCGDTLFQASVGRSDLWGGDTKKLIHSIRSRILSLDDDTEVYPGHGPSTRVGIERRTNPFLI